MPLRKRLTLYGTVFTPVLLLLLLLIPSRAKPAAPAALASPSSRAATLNAAAADGTLGAVAVDVMDTQTVVKAWIERTDALGQPVREPVTSGVSWTIESGTAVVTQEPYTGRTVFKPRGSTPVVARPSLGDLVGPPVRIGLDPGVLPWYERGLTVAGGGSCQTSDVVTATADVEPPAVDVRAVVDATVIPLSRTERVIRYERGEYFAHHPDMGIMRLRYNPNQTSEIVLRSLDPTGQSFFPASAQGRLFFIMEVLDSGIKLFNPEPMLLSTPSTNWPPFEIPMLNDAPVSFHSQDNPEVEILRIESQELYLYPTTELAISNRKFLITGDLLEASFGVKNLTAHPGEVRWFLLGDVGTPLAATDGLLSLAPGAERVVTFRSRLAPSSLAQAITFGAVSQSEPRMTGTRRRSFRYPPR
jgi:hypothetical protein